MFRRARPVFFATVLLLGCGGSDEQEPTPPNPSNPSNPSNTSKTSKPGTPLSNYEARCCINGAFYECATAAAFERCAGGDPVACHAACAFDDPQCHMSCDQALADPDPSLCTRTPAKDGECQRPSQPGDPSGPSDPGDPLGCNANATGKRCNDSDDCGWTNHCFVGHCYENRSGSPCFGDDDCGYVSACVGGCCN